MSVRAEVQMTLPPNPVAQITNGVLRGLNKSAERGLALTLQGVPMRDGILAGSGTVERATDIEEGAAIVYDTPYAVRLHEHPEYNFSKDANPNAEGKWVENGVLRGKNEIEEIMQAEVRRG